MLKIFLLSFTLCLFVTNLYAKRRAPEKVVSISRGDITYKIPHTVRANDSYLKGGIVEAYETKTSKLLWRIEVYKIKYDPNLERDVQDVFITSVKFSEDGKSLIIVDEKRRLFEVDLASRKVNQVLINNMHNMQK